MANLFAESDLETAKKELEKNRLSIVIVKNGRIIFQSSEHGIKPLLSAIDRFSLVDSSVADVVVGKAAAMLFAKAGIISVYGRTISNAAADFLEAQKIEFDYGVIVENILNKNKDDLCPFEKLLAGCEDPEEAYEKINSFLR